MATADAVNWTNITNIEQIMGVANTNTGGWFWVSALYMVWVILVISTLNFGIEVALLGASFSCFILGILLSYLGLISWLWTTIFMGIILVTVFVKIISSKE